MQTYIVINNTLDHTAGQNVHRAVHNTLELKVAHTLHQVPLWSERRCCLLEERRRDLADTRGKKLVAYGNCKSEGLDGGVLTGDGDLLLLKSSTQKIDEYVMVNETE